MRNLIKTAAFLLAFAVPTAAYAQVAPAGTNDGTDQAAPDVDNDGADEELVRSQDPAQPLPPSQSDSDPLPPVAVPEVPPGGVVEQAGVGGQTAYGRAGVLELGGAAGFTRAEGFTTANLSPFIGWFVATNFQISGILDVSHIRADDAGSTLVRILVEPSYHLPFSRSLFGFIGIGMGGAYVDDVGLGFALAPRFGANIMVGRSGILTPSLTLQYTTHDAMEVGNTTLTSVTTALAANIGYTVMW